MANHAIHLQPAYVNGSFCMAVIPVSSAVVEFSIVPSAAVLTITSGKVYNQSGHNIETELGGTIGYTVSASGYESKSGTITVNKKKQTVSISL